MATLLQDRRDFLTVLEKDLINKVKEAVAAAGMSGSVHGCFSLDDLENKNANDLCGGIAFGVGYLGITPVTEHASQLNPGKSNAVQNSDVMFTILVAAPVDELCSQRCTGMTLLTVLRQGILGRDVVIDLGEEPSRNAPTRTWFFVKEKPEVSESTENMLYYTQVWRLVLPMKGN